MSSDAAAPAAVDGNESLEEFKARLIRYYNIYAPTRLATIDAIVAKYQGQQKELWAAMIKKYGPENPTAAAETPAEELPSVMSPMVPLPPATAPVPAPAAPAAAVAPSASQAPVTTASEQPTAPPVVPAPPVTSEQPPVPQANPPAVAQPQPSSAPAAVPATKTAAPSAPSAEASQSVQPTEPSKRPFRGASMIQGPSAGTTSSSKPAPLEVKDVTTAASAPGAKSGSTPSTAKRVGFTQAAVVAVEPAPSESEPPSTEAPTEASEDSPQRHAAVKSSSDPASAGKKATTTSSASSSSAPAIKIDPVQRERLVKFYNRVAREKVGKVDEALTAYAGREALMWQLLEQKYGPEIVASPVDAAAPAGGVTEVAPVPVPTSASPPPAATGTDTNLARSESGVVSTAAPAKPTTSTPRGGAVALPMAMTNSNTMAIASTFDHLTALSTRRHIRCNLSSVIGPGFERLAAAVLLLLDDCRQEDLFDVTQPTIACPLLVGSTSPAAKYLANGNPQQQQTRRIMTDLDRVAFNLILDFRFVWIQSWTEGLRIRQAELTERKLLQMACEEGVRALRYRDCVWMEAKKLLEPVETQQRELIASEERILLEGMRSWFRRRRDEMLYESYLHATAEVMLVQQGGMMGNHSFTSAAMTSSTAVMSNGAGGSDGADRGTFAAKSRDRSPSMANMRNVAATEQRHVIANKIEQVLANVARRSLSNDHHRREELHAVDARRSASPKQQQQQTSYQQPHHDAPTYQASHVATGYGYPPQLSPSPSPQRDTIPQPTGLGTSTVSFSRREKDPYANPAASLAGQRRETLIGVWARQVAPPGCFSKMVSGGAKAPTTGTATSAHRSKTPVSSFIHRTSR